MLEKLLLSVVVLGGRSQVGPAQDGSLGNLVPSNGDQHSVGGSTINNETAPYPGVPDKHGISFVLSDLPISFIVVRKPESRQLPGRERKKDLTGPVKERSE